MNDNLELGKTKVASSMPPAYVEFVRRLWRKQEKESRYTWGRELELARRPVFLRLLASDKLGAELRRAYETAVGAKIAEALTRQAVHIPELWVGEDQRTKNEKVAQFPPSGPKPSPGSSRPSPSTTSFATPTTRTNSTTSARSKPTAT